MNRFRTFVSVALTAALIALAGMVWAAAKDSIETAPQPAGDSVTIPKVTIAHNGWLVIHDSDANGNIMAPESIGHVYLKRGTHENVTVKLDHPVTAGTKLYAMLHHDTGKKEVYEYGKDSTRHDKPIKVKGKVVVEPFEIQ